jgi:UDP-2,3-diacylglucosamine pyrophosphatase LpxH
MLLCIVVPGNMTANHHQFKESTMEETRIIISDLHVGQNDEFDIFAGPGKADSFINFIKHIRDLKKPVELVINGDFVDFLQLQPWNDLSRVAASEKIRRIVTQSSYFFDELGTLLNDELNKLVILPGNHDVELAYPEVGKVLREAILKTAPGAVSRIQMFDSNRDRRSIYRPVINNVLVHIEHGNEGDPWNTLYYPTLFTDAETNSSGFSYPPGTKLVYETMNDFKELFRFVDLLKPEMPAVVLILLALKPFMSTLKIPKAAMTSLEMVGNAALVALRRAVAGPQMGALASNPEVTTTDKLENFLTAELPADLPTAWEVEQFLNNPDDTEGTMGPRIDKVKMWFVSWALRGLARFQAKERGAKFYEEDHKRNRAAKGGHKRLVGDIKVVVFGHTHEALKTEFPEGVYVNCGTWANLVDLPKDAKSTMLQWLEELATNQFMRTAFPTFVKIEPAATGVTVSLNSWTVNGADTLWMKNISQ